MGKRTGKTQKRKCRYCDRMIGIAGFARFRHLSTQHPQEYRASQIANRKMEKFFAEVQAHARGRVNE